MSTSIDIGSTVTTPIKTLYRDLAVGLGTGFFYSHHGQLFLITNWHVVTGRHFQTLNPLHSKGALPDRLEILVGCKGSIGEWMELHCTLYEDASTDEQPERPKWFEHAVHGHKIDVVAIPVNVPEDARVYTIDRVNTVPNMLLTISKDVFVIGYPKGISGGRGFPIWKRASIATEPGIQLDGLPKLLIDSASREGMSGAPVIAISDGEFDVEGPPPAYRLPGRAYRFVGVYSGRLGQDEIEAQLGIVWKAEAVTRILEAPCKGKSSFHV